MGYSTFDRHESRKKDRRKNRYEIQRIIEDEDEMIRAEDVKDGNDNSDRARKRAGDTGRN